MLIDLTYFVGPLKIAQLDSTPVSDRLNLFIQKFEPVYLELMLGEEMHAEFAAGISQTSVEQKWLDLLGQLIKSPFSINVSTGSKPDILVEVDATMAASNRYVHSEPIPEAYRVVQRGFGPLKESEITRYADGFGTLSQMEIGNVYFIQYTDGGIITIPGNSVTSLYKKSPVANFIYYWYISDNDSFTTGSGEKKAKSQSSYVSDPKYKLCLAWNEMVEENMKLIDFIKVGDYSSFSDPECSVDVRRESLLIKKNRLGL